MLRFILLLIKKTHKSLTWNIINIMNHIKLYTDKVIIGNKAVLAGIINIDKHPESDIIIGNNFSMLGGYGFNPIGRNLSNAVRTEKGAKIIIGNNVGISSVCLWAKSSIKIGNNVKIGANTIVIDNDCHSLIYTDRRMPIMDCLKTKTKPIEIGDDVLIGANCIILKGVKIGSRSIIGAGSIVTNNVSNDTIVAGNPCKIIKNI